MAAPMVQNEQTEQGREDQQAVIAAPVDTRALIEPPPVSLEKKSTENPGFFPRKINQAKALWEKISAREGVAHLLRAFTRFSDRLGTQFGAAITYFSFLSVIPILMVAFGVISLVLRGNKAALDTVSQKVQEQIPGDLGATFLKSALTSGTAVGIVGLVVALYSGVSWVSNIREAVHAQWRPTFEKSKAEKAESFLSILLGNLVTFVSLGAALLISVVLTTVGGAAQNFVLGLLGLDGISWLKPVVGIGTFAIAIAADLLIFIWFYRRMQIEDFTPPPGAVFRGAAIAAVAFEVLKVAMTLLIPLLNNSASFRAFGYIILLLFFFNIVAQVVLFVAAWIGTAGGIQAAAAPQEIPGPSVVVHADAASRKVSLVGAGAVVGFLAGRRRR